MATLYKVEMYVVDKCGGVEDNEDVIETIKSAVRMTSLREYSDGIKITEIVPFVWGVNCPMDNRAVTEEEIETFIRETNRLNTAIAETCKGTGNAIKEMLEGYGVEANERNMTAYISQLIKESKD